MLTEQGKTLLHNIRVALYLVSILTILALLLLVSCGGETIHGTIYVDDMPSSVEITYEYALRACLEHGYPDYRLFDDGTIYCMKQSSCTDIVKNLANLRERK